MRVLSAPKEKYTRAAELKGEKIRQEGCIPATPLGHLATEINYQKTKELRIGETLLVDAMFRTHLAARSVASFGLIVYVLKSDPTGFYRRNGFIDCVNTPDRMYLPMKTIEDTLCKARLIGG